MNPKKHIVSEFPIHLDIELNTDCNLKCEFCPNYSPQARYPPPKNKLMSWELYKKIIDEGSEKGLCAITLCFRGEPLLCDYIYEAIAYAKQKKIMDVRINTNGTLLSELNCVQLIASGLDLFILSDYSIPKQLEGIINLKKMKEQFHSDHPKIRIKSNNPMKWEGLYDELNELITHDYNSGEEMLKKSEFECEQLWQRLTILYNGNVKMCCSSVLFPESILGNVLVCSIEWLWNSTLMNYYRWCHQNHKAHLLKSCRYCPGMIEYNKKKKEKKNGKKN